MQGYTGRETPPPLSNKQSEVERESPFPSLSTIFYGM